MNTILWICQSVAAVVFLYSGFCKTTLPEKVLIAKGQTGVVGLPAALIKFIGTSEILGAIGLILPGVLHIATILTPIAAICFATVMVLAAPIHYRLKEYNNIRINVSLFLLCSFIAWGRLAINEAVFKSSF